jgi:hypothetical protein
MQSLTNSLLVARLFGSRPVLGVLVTWQTCLLWSSLSSADTAALHSLAVRGLEPAVKEGPRHKTVSKHDALGGLSPAAGPLCHCLPTWGCCLLLIVFVLIGVVWAAGLPLLP